MIGKTITDIRPPRVIFDKPEPPEVLWKKLAPRGDANRDTLVSERLHVHVSQHEGR